MVFDSYLSSPEFHCLIDIDTSKYRPRFSFTKYKNGKLKIEATDNNGQDVIIGQNLSTVDVFGMKNPFAKLDSLSMLKDKLKVYSIIYNRRIGDFIQFYVTNEDVLTYIPDYDKLNPKYKDIWIEIFSNGKNIKSNWNLRKLDEPKDNG